MPRKSQPTTSPYGLDVAYTYPYYATAADYMKATGNQPPPYDPTKYPKYWMDPEAVGLSDDEQITYMVGYLGTTGGVKLVNGKPALVRLNLMPSEAAVVNIPGPGTFPAGVVKPIERMPPIELLPNEELELQGGPMGGTLLRIRRTDLTDSTTMTDRQLLEAIARKVGV